VQVARETALLVLGRLERILQALPLAAQRGDLVAQARPFGEVNRRLLPESLPLGDHADHLSRNLWPGGAWNGNEGRLLLGARAAAHRLDDPRELAQRTLERTDVTLTERARRNRNQDQAPERRDPGVERDAGHRTHRADGVDQPGHVPIVRGALDQIGATIEQAVEWHVPRGRVPVPHAPEPLASLVRETDLRREPQQPMTLVEEA